MAEAAAWSSPSRWLKIAGIATVALGVWMFVEALRLFDLPNPAEHGTAWRYWIGGMLATAIGVLPWGARRPHDRKPTSRWELAAFGAVMLVACAFRFYMLDSYPEGLWFDEGANGLEAVKILENPGYRPVFVAGISQMAAMFFYYCAAFFEIFGTNTYTLRLTTTVMGLGAIAVVWALGRELWSRELGLFAAAFLAFSRWHVTFSRFAMAHMSLTFFLPLALWLFLRALRRESPRSAVWAGLVLGLGLQFYYSMMVTPILLALVAGRLLLRRDTPKWFIITLLLLTVGTTALAYSPVAQYASKNPLVFNQRMRRVSVFKTRGFGEALQLMSEPSERRDKIISDIQKSIVRHAKMFHISGDRNGRHNLSSTPMLDPITGVFFALGFGLCVIQFWEPRRMLLLAWFGAMMSSGVLSLVFEAPQAGRTFGNSAVACLMAALPIALLVRAVTKRNRKVAIGLVLAILPLLGWAAAINWQIYFGPQRSNLHSWGGWSAPQTRIGRDVAALEKPTDLYVTPAYFGGPSITFILGKKLEANALDLDAQLPFVPSGRDVRIYLRSEDNWRLDQLLSYYPNADIEPVGPPQQDGSIGTPLLWIVRIPHEQLIEPLGWQVSRVVDGKVATSERSTDTAWTWPGGTGPDAKLVVRGMWRIAHDQPTQLFVEHDGGAELRVDGQVVLAHPGLTELDLSRGLHRIELQLTDGRGRSRFLWLAKGDDGPRQHPTAGNMFTPELQRVGLLGEYIKGRSCEGPRRFARLDYMVANLYHRAPVPRPFAVRWSGSLYAPKTGTYKLATKSRDDTTLLIDGKQILENHTGDHLAKEIHLDEGWHDVDLCYRLINAHARVFLQWALPRDRFRIIPWAVLRPPGPDGERLALDAPPPPDLTSLQVRPEQRLPER